MTPRPGILADGLPTTLATAIPWLWQRILFPGPQASRLDKPRWRSLAILIVLPAIVLYPCTSFYLFEPDEGRYAEIPREMLEQGEWIVPLLQGRPYLDKPPLFYWSVMASYLVFGLHDWAARLIPALAVHGCILLVYFFGMRNFGERTGFWSALGLAVVHGFEGMARLLILDGLLTFLTAFALFALFEATERGRFSRGWWIAAAIACGLGILTKGPVILILALVPWWLYRRLTAASATAGRRWALLFGIVVAAIALPWYVAICVRLPGFIHHFLWVHNVQRFFQPFDHIEPVWFYVPILFAGTLPASLLLIPFVRFLSSGRLEEAQHRSPVLGYCLVAALWCIAFFSLSGSKLPTYILPAFPPLMLAVGHFVAVSRWSRSRITWAAVGISYGLMVIGNYWLMPYYAHYRSPMKHRDDVASYCHDPATPIVCFPRHVDSVSFYLRRGDMVNFRSKHIQELIEFLDRHPKTVILFTHRHSSQGLRQLLPPHLQMVGRRPMGLCDMAYIINRAK